MSGTAKRESFEEPEEGEIVDDFEDISDYSIQSPSHSGKSVSLQDLLQDVSLSSISDTGDDDIRIVRYDPFSNGKRDKRKRKGKYVDGGRSKRRKKLGEHYAKPNHKKISRKQGESTSNSDGDKLDYHTLKLLKDTMRIDTPSKAKRKSLRMRLQAMSQLNSVQSQAEEEEEEALRMLALLSNTPKINQETNDLKSCPREEDVIEILEENKNEVVNEFVDDEELIELRLAALKSAVIKRSMERKKRKEQLGANDTNKENDVNKDNNKMLPIENDHDANGDAGAYSKEAKNTSQVTTIVDVNANPELVDNNILKSGDAMDNVSLEEDVDIMRAMLLASMSKRITSNSAQHTTVPADNNQSIQGKNIFSMEKNVMKWQNVFKNSNLPNVKPLIINLGESDSDTDVLDKNNKGQKDVVSKDKNWADSVTQFLKQQRAAVEAKSVIQNHLNKELLLDKSVVKLLPKSQQREYQFLKQKLLMEKKKRLRKMSNKNNVKNLPAKKLVKVKAQNVGANRSQQDVNLHGLQTTLEDMQIQKDGRLQMKGKYKELTPLLREVNETTAERKKCEMEIKRQLEELKKTRNKLTAVNQQFTNLVKRLMNEKEAIDRRPIKKINSETQPVLISAKNTSTPIKNAQVAVSDDACIKDLSSIGTKVDENLDVCPKLAENNLDTDLPVKKYVSPLDIKNRGDVVSDPFATFCPYELFGVCKDPECNFSHYSKT